jgi:RHS repeat-associated protein
MFQGREYLSELGISDFRTRFYHPGLGRFLQKDPLGFGGGDANLFRFCGGDPVNGSDPSGLLEKTKPSGKSPPPIRPYEPVNFGSNGYTPTGSLIPQSVTGIWNGGSWDLSSHDYVNGTQSLGSFVLVGGLGGGGSSTSGGGGGGGGAQFVSTSTPFGRAIELATRALDAIAPQAKNLGVEMGGTVLSNGKMHVDAPGTSMMMTITFPSGAIASFHIHQLIGPNPYEFSHPPTGLDSYTLIQQHPNMVHLIGILDGPPGQFTIRAYVPEQGEFWQRPNPPYTPGFEGGH